MTVVLDLIDGIDAAHHRHVQLGAVRAGDRERGYELAREAYLEHFEYTEIPLRLRDPNLVLDLEFDFAAFRDGIRAGDEIGHHLARVRGLSPLATLERGYAVAQLTDGTVVTSVTQVAEGTELTIRVADGSIGARATTIETMRPAPEGDHD